MNTSSKLSFVDIIHTPNSLFQITISKGHPIKQEPLRKILKKLSATEKILLYFVVPEDNFNDFTTQNYQNKQRKASKKVPKSVVKLEQWVIGVPLRNKEKAEQSEVQSIRKRAADQEDIAANREDIGAEREDIAADRGDIAADEDDMQQPQTKKRRMKLNVGETYQSQTQRKMGLNEKEIAAVKDFDE